MSMVAFEMLYGVAWPTKPKNALTPLVRAWRRTAITAVRTAGMRRIQLRLPAIAVIPVVSFESSGTKSDNLKG